MSNAVNNLRPLAAERFEVARRCLLPNEEVRFICEVLSGFLVLTDRRLVLLGEDARLPHRIERAIPVDCIKEVQQVRADRVQIIGITLDNYGRQTPETASLDIKAPQVQRGENKNEVLDNFHAAMVNCYEMVEEIRRSEVPPLLDFSYLSALPASLTRDAMLDLNTILRDLPVPDTLVPEAAKFLGDTPLLLEECLRAGDDREDGVLLAAGECGYYWVRGKKQGRFMSNVVVDTVEWENVLSFAQQWQEGDATIHATYRLTGDGKASTVQYQWCPPITEDTMQFPWLVQPFNGLWIILDIMHRYSGTQVRRPHDP